MAAFYNLLPLGYCLSGVLHLGFGLALGYEKEGNETAATKKKRYKLDDVFGCHNDEVLQKSPILHRCRMGLLHRFKMLRIFSSFAPRQCSSELDHCTRFGVG